MLSEVRRAGRSRNPAPEPAEGDLHFEMLEFSCEPPRYRLAAIIWAACCRLVSVTVAPLNMRATSWVLAR